MKYGMDCQLVPLISPVDLGSVDTGSAFINVENAQWISFIIPLGTITGDTVTVTVEESSAASSGAEVAVPFMYRLSSALGTDSWGAPTSATSAGVAVSADEDDKLLLIEIDPATLDDGYNYLRVFFDLGSSATVAEVAVVAALEPRYKQYNPVPSC